MKLRVGNGLSFPFRRSTQSNTLLSLAVAVAVLLMAVVAALVAIVPLLLAKALAAAHLPSLR